MRKHTSRDESGQVLFVFIPVLSILMIAAIVMFNVVMIETSALTTVDNSLRLAGIAALQDRAPGPDAYSTWIFDDTGNPGSVLDCTVQRLVYENLAPQLGMFVSDPATVTGYSPGGGCAAMPVTSTYFLKVEALTPGTAPPVDYLNGVAQATVACAGGIKSSLDGICRTKPTIVISLKVQIVQLGNLTWLPPGGSMTRTVVVSAGTDG